MTPEQRELIQIVTDDLDWLRETWDQTIDDASLRRSSTVLRRLLVGEGVGDYSNAWRAIGFKREPTVQAFDLAAHVRAYMPESIVFAQAGGAEFGGMQVQPAMILNYAMSAEEMAARYKAGYPTLRWYGLREFVESPAIIYKGATISRRLIVKYVANKRGGAHLDFAREAKTLAEFGALDEISDGTIVIADKDAMYYELLSIGQALARSTTTQQFIDKVRSLLAH